MEKLWDLIKKHPEGVILGVFGFLLIIVLFSRGKSSNPQALLAQTKSQELANEHDLGLARIQEQGATSQARIAASSANIAARLGAAATNLQTRLGAKISEYTLQNSLYQNKQNTTEESALAELQLQEAENANAAADYQSHQQANASSDSSLFGGLGLLGGLALL